MTLDGFLTFLGLVAAALAVVPPVVRLQLRVALGRLTFWLVGLAILALYLEFFDALAPRCPAWLGSWCPTLSKTGSLTPPQAAFLVVLVWLLIFASAVLRPRASVRAMPVLARLVDRLVEANRLADLVDLMEHDLALIDACAAGELPYQRRRAKLIGDPIAPHRIALLEALLGAPPHEKDRWYVVLWASLKRGHPNAAPDERKLVDPLKVVAVWWSSAWCDLKRDLAALIPLDTNERTAAEEVMHILLRNPKVVAYVAEHRPKFGARLLGMSSYSVRDFVDAFLHQLMSRTDSALYREVGDTQNIAKFSYEVMPRNAILYAIFNNAEHAQRLEVYRPIGEYVLFQLSPANNSEYCIELNKDADVSWEDRTRWRDPTFVALHFFDIMVRAAVSQGIQWHMWLYYLPHFVNSLETIYNPSPRGASSGELPTRAAQLLYSIFDNLTEWVLLATQVELGSPHRQPDNSRVDHENGNIPKSSAIALGMCLKTVLQSDRIEDVVKQSLLRAALRGVAKLSLEADGILRQVLVDSLANGGIVAGGPTYRARLLEQYGDLVTPWDQDLQDFEAAIGWPLSPYGVDGG